MDGMIISGGLVVGVIIVVLVLIILASCINIVPQANAYIIERLGAYIGTWSVGIHFKVPFLDRVVRRVNLKEQVMDFPPQPVITKDNVTMQIDTVVFFQITDPKLFTYGVENPIMAIENLTATTLRNIIGDLELDQTLTSRETINTHMRSNLDIATDPWGIKVNRVELKNIIPPREIQDSMEKQMKAERERRESILRAEGEKKSTVLVAEGKKESAILEAEAEKEAAILRAEAKKEAMIREAEGRAQAIEAVQRATAEGIRFLNEADPSKAVLTIKSLEAFEKAAREMGCAETFHGYGPEQGYDFLRERIRAYYRQNAGVDLDPQEIFISDGAKSDLGNILDLFDRDNRVLIPSPVYPVYVDTNVMAGRTIQYLEASRDNGFLPMPPEEAADIIYLCSPNNPTGAAYNREQLKVWVEYANRCGAVLLYDAAYEAFVTDPACPRSIYEIKGAETCAIEFCSLSKTAGFTGTRCGYTVVPLALERQGRSLHHFWLRRQTTKFNGVPYIVQRGAEAVFSPEAVSYTHLTLPTNSRV